MKRARPYEAVLVANGKEYPLHRDVATPHSTAVHRALGTSSEAEIQRHLDACYVGDWYGPEGEHLGPDSCGLAMFWLDANGERIETERPTEIVTYLADGSDPREAT